MVIAVAERDQIFTGWTTIYPRDPALKASLQSCAMEDPQFNRLNADARLKCYDKWLPVIDR